MPKYFDTHAHTHFTAYHDDSDEVVKRAQDEDVWMTNVGTSFETSKQAVEFAQKYSQGVFATIGVHPGHTWQSTSDADEADHAEESFDPSIYAGLITDKTVAVGEIGLDYFRMPAEDEVAKNKQKTSFVAQLHFAKEHNLPVVIHCRDAYADTLDILKAEYNGSGILHSFTDTWETAEKFLDLGLYVALNGILTFDKSGRLKEVCQNLPADKILAETDAPYLAPPPFRGKRNEPLYVKYVVELMAQLRGVPLELMAQQTVKNALDIYQIKLS